MNDYQGHADVFMRVAAYYTEEKRGVEDDKLASAIANFMEKLFVRLALEYSKQQYKEETK